MSLRTIIAAVALVIAPVALAPTAFAQAAENIYTKNGDVAVNGYDPVAYFTISEPTRGSADITSTVDGAIYRFASEENKALFDANPDAYRPQYGGHCAWAAAQGNVAAANPNNWAIVGDKLYLNFNSGIQRRWDRDREGFIAAADEQYPTLFTSAQQGNGSSARRSGRGS